MNPEANPMPLVSDCDPVDACECPCCSTVFRVRTLMTDGAGRLMRDEYETIPMFCPMCGGRLEDGRRVTCAILISSSKQGGLSCDWEHATKTAEKTE